MKERVTRSSGNIFADLGLKNSSDLMLKARMALLIRQIIAAKKLSQTAAAGQMGLAQADVSRILRGQLSGYSLERLFDGIKALGNTIEIKVKDERTGRVLMRA